MRISDPFALLGADAASAVLASLNLKVLDPFRSLILGREVFALASAGFGHFARYENRQSPIAALYRFHTDKVARQTSD